MVKDKDLIIDENHFKLITFSVLLCCTFCVYRQASLGISYKVAARNSSCTTLASTALSLCFTIYDSVAKGSIVFRDMPLCNRIINNSESNNATNVDWVLSVRSF
jgi:hypothetical protein